MTQDIKRLEVEIEILRNENEKFRQEIKRLRGYLVASYRFPPEWYLPRREYDILAILASGKGWITKDRIGFLIGLSDAEIEAVIVESHVSKLKKKIVAMCLPINLMARRFQGYMLDDDSKEYLQQFKIQDGNNVRSQEDT